MTAQALNHLKEFVALVDHLNERRLAKNLLSGSIKVQWQGNWQNVEIVNFDEDDCMAFLLSCRMLVQNNEKISIKCVADIVAESDFPAAIKDAVWADQFRLNLTLYEECPIAAPGHAEALTNWEVFRTFLWGAYAHRCMNPELRERFLLWQTLPQQFYPLKTNFLLMLKVLLEAANDIAMKVGSEIEVRQ